MTLCRNLLELLPVLVLFSLSKSTWYNPNRSLHWARKSLRLFSLVLKLKLFYLRISTRPLKIVDYTPCCVSNNIASIFQYGILNGLKVSSQILHPADIINFTVVRPTIFSYKYRWIFVLLFYPTKPSKSVFTNNKFSSKVFQPLTLTVFSIRPVCLVTRATQPEAKNHFEY